MSATWLVEVSSLHTLSISRRFLASTASEQLFKYRKSSTCIHISHIRSTMCTFLVLTVIDIVGTKQI